MSQKRVANTRDSNRCRAGEKRQITESQQVEQFRLLKIPGSNRPVAKLGISVDAKLEDQRPNLKKYAFR